MSRSSQTSPPEERANSPKTSKGRVWRVLRGILLWTLGGLAAVVLLVGAVLAFVFARPGVIREPVNQILAGVVAGNIEITHIDSISWDGFSGVDARLQGASGRGLVHLYDVSAELSWLGLVQEILSSDPSLDINIEELRAGHLHLDVSQNSQGEVAFIEALTPPPSQPSTSSRPVAISFDSIHLDDGWVHGKLADDSLLDAQIDSLDLSLSVAEDLKIQDVQLVAKLREPHQYETPFKLQGKTRIVFHEDSAASSNASVLQTLSSDSVIELNAGESEVFIDAHQDREEFELLIKGSFAAAEARKIDLALTAPLDFELEASGNLSDIEAKLEAEYDDARLSVQGHAQHGEDWTLDGTLSLKQLDLSSFGVEQVSPLNADAKFEATRVAGDDLAGLQRYSGQVRGEISSFSAKNQPIPALNFEASLEDGELAVKAQSLREQGETRITVETNIEPSGEIDRVFVSGQLQASHAVPYVPQLQHLDGEVQFSGEVSLNSQTLDAEVKARLQGLQTNLGLGAKSLTVEARASGEWTNPRIRAVVEGKGLAIDQERVEQFHARVDGSLSQAHVEVRGTGRGLLARVEGDIGFEGSRFRASDFEGELSRAGNRIGVSLGSLSVDGQKSRLRTCL